jgi:hypothetical protein
MKKAADDKAAQKKASKGKNSIMNGRALFSYNPDLFKDDENAGAADDYEEEKQAETVDAKLFAGEAINEEEEVDFD